MGIEMSEQLCKTCSKRGTRDSEDSGYASGGGHSRTASQSSMLSTGLEEERPSITLSRRFLKIPALAPHQQPASRPRSDSAASSITYASSTTPASEHRSTADCARSLLACLPHSIPRVTRNDTGVSLGVAVLEETAEVVGAGVVMTAQQEGSRAELQAQAPNMHWGGFDDRSYVDVTEEWP